MTATCSDVPDEAVSCEEGCRHLRLIVGRSQADQPLSPGADGLHLPRLTGHDVRVKVAGEFPVGADGRFRVWATGRTALAVPCMTPLARGLTMELCPPACWR
jgi:hypothetical protein